MVTQIESNHRIYIYILGSPHFVDPYYFLRVSSLDGKVLFYREILTFEKLKQQFILFI